MNDLKDYELAFQAIDSLPKENTSVATIAAEVAAVLWKQEDYKASASWADVAMAFPINSTDARLYLNCTKVRFRGFL